MEFINPSKNSNFRVTNENFVVTMSREKVKTILSIPHDWAPRYEYDWIFIQRPKDLTSVRDLNVWGIARDIFSNTSESSLIRWLLPRTIVDYNRRIDGKDYTFYQDSPQIIEPAFFDPWIELYYNSYHDSLSKEIQQAIDCFWKEAILLIDLHWFTSQPPYSPKWGYDLILWTWNRKTILHGEKDLELHEFLSKRWYKVFLPQKNPIINWQEDKFDAWHITRYHSEVSWINTIQIEIASRFRQKDDKREWMALSENISEFIENN